MILEIEFKKRFFRKFLSKAHYYPAYHIRAKWTDWTIPSDGDSPYKYVFCLLSFLICCGREARASIVPNIEWVQFVLYCLRRRRSEPSVYTNGPYKWFRQVRGPAGTQASLVLLFCKETAEYRGEVVTSRCHRSKFSGWQQTKTLFKKWIRTVSNLIDLIFLSNLPIVGEIFWVKSERTVPKFRKRKRKFLCCAHLIHKAGAWNWEVSCRSRATTAKKCTKKRDASAKLFF